MRFPHLYSSVAVALVAASGATAQPSLYGGVGAGYARSTVRGRHGASADLSAVLEWKGVLVHLHAADVGAERGRTFGMEGSARVVTGHEWYSAFSFALDAGYEIPVSKSVGVMAGAGSRFHAVERDLRRYNGRFAQSPYVYGGALLGRPDQVRLYGRLELDAAVLEGAAPKRVQIGLLVPLVR